MSDQIDRNTMQVHKSVNTPDFSQNSFLNISGKTLPNCDKKYWKIVGEEVVEMTIEEKTVIDYTPPTPEPEPKTQIQLEIERKQKIADGIAEKYTLADENSMMRKLITGESVTGDADIKAWLNWVAVKKAEYPKVA